MLVKGKRKTARPLSVKNPIHLVLKLASNKNGSHKYFSPRNKSLKNLISAQANKFNIRIYDIAINWTHIHFTIKINSRQDYIRFIRGLTSVLSLKIRKHLGFTTFKIFALRPYTRIIQWGGQLKTIRGYHLKNRMQAEGRYRFEQRHEQKRYERHHESSYYYNCIRSYNYCC